MRLVGLLRVEETLVLSDEELGVARRDSALRELEEGEESRLESEERLPSREGSLDTTGIEMARFIFGRPEEVWGGERVPWSWSQQSSQTREGMIGASSDS